METKFDLSLVPVLWYENKKGERYVWKMEGEDRFGDPPPGFIYQHSQFPSDLRHTILRGVVSEEVAACPHPVEDIRKTYGWIEGVEGRECTSCRGTQTKKVEEAWPEKWDANGSNTVGAGTSSWPEDLVLKMATKSWWGWLRGRKVYTLGEAIRIVANSCERCMNVLGHRYRVGWGYAEGSKDWVKSGTKCQFCKGLFFSGGVVR